MKIKNIVEEAIFVYIKKPWAYLLLMLPSAASIVGAMYATLCMPISVLFWVLLLCSSLCHAAFYVLFVSFASRPSCVNFKKHLLLTLIWGITFCVMSCATKITTQLFLLGFAGNIIILFFYFVLHSACIFHTCRVFFDSKPGFKAKAQAVCFSFALFALIQFAGLTIANPGKTTVIPLSQEEINKNEHIVMFFFTLFFIPLHNLVLIELYKSTAADT